jgi:hypothetical protein
VLDYGGVPLARSDVPRKATKHFFSYLGAYGFIHFTAVSLIDEPSPGRIPANRRASSGVMSSLIR